MFSDTDSHQLLTQALEAMHAKDRALGAAHAKIVEQRKLIHGLSSRLGAVETTLPASVFDTELSSQITSTDQDLRSMWARFVKH
jgi:hypothetical protein